MKEKAIGSWPNNLIDAVFGEETTVLPTDDIFAGVDFAIKSLPTPREQRFVWQYYKSEFTLEQIGHESGLTKSRVQQIIHRALRRLRHPSRCCFLMYGLKGSEEYNEYTIMRGKYAELWQEYVKLLEKVEQLKQEVSDREPETPIETKNEPQFPWIPDDLMSLDLSVRSFNCLRRADAITIDDIVDLLKTGKIRYLRNFGKRSLDEVITKVKDKFGIDCSDYYDEHLNYKGVKTND